MVVMMARKDSNDPEMKADDAEDELSAKEKIKKYGIAGIVSWTLWKLSFNLVSLLIAAFGFYQTTGNLPNLTNFKELAALSGSSLALNVATSALVVPLRLGLAIKTAKWVDENILSRFKRNNEIDLK